MKEQFLQKGSDFKNGIKDKVPIKKPTFSSKENKTKWNISYVLWWIGILLVIGSIFLPWWALQADVEGADVDGSPIFEIGVKPFRGPYLNTPVVGLQDIASIYVTAISQAIMLPLLIPLIFTSLYGIYSGIRRRVSKKMLVAPFWLIVAIITWFSYYHATSSLLSQIGLDIPATGSETLSLGDYTLASASWGWGFGFYFSIFAAALLFTSSYLMRKYKLPSGSSLKIKREFSIHSFLLVVFAFGYIFLGILIIVFTRLLPIPSTGAIFPLVSGVVIFGMARCASKEFYKCPKCGGFIKINNVKDDYICETCRTSLFGSDVSQNKKSRTVQNIADKGSKIRKDVKDSSKNFYKDVKEDFNPKKPSSPTKKQIKKHTPYYRDKTDDSWEKSYKYRYCPFCGFEIRDTFVYCPECGEDLPNNGVRNTKNPLDKR